MIKTTFEQLEKMQGKIVLHYSRQDFIKNTGLEEMVYTIFPAFDSKKRQYPGVPIVSDSDKAKYAYLPTPKTSRTLTHGYTLDLDNPVDKADWGWMIHSGIIFPTRAEAKSKGICFYVYQPEEIPTQELREWDLIEKATGIVNALTDGELGMFARRLGHQMIHQAPIMTRSFLKRLAHDKQTAQKVIDAEKDPFAPIKEFIYKAIDEGVISYDSYSKCYKWNTYLLGESIEEIIQWMGKSEHRDMIEGIKAAVNKDVAIVTEPDKAEEAAEALSDLLGLSPGVAKPAPKTAAKTVAKSAAKTAPKTAAKATKSSK